MSTDTNKQIIRDHLLMVLSEATSFVYETTEQDYDSLSADLKRVIDSIHIAEAVVSREL